MINHSIPVSIALQETYWNQQGLGKCYFRNKVAQLCVHKTSSVKYVEGGGQDKFLNLPPFLHEQNCLYSNFQSTVDCTYLKFQNPGFWFVMAIQIWIHFYVCTDIIKKADCIT